MDNRTPLLNYIPERFRLFIFYTVMAWLSLIKPEEGKNLVAAADNYTREQQKKAIYKAWRGIRNDQS